MSELKVQFGEGRGIVAPLEIRGPAEAMAIEHLYGMLFALRVQVVSAEEHVEEDGIVQRLLVCEFDGGPLRFQRRRAITAKMTAALSRPGPGIVPAHAPATARDRRAA